MRSKHYVTAVTWSDTGVYCPRSVVLCVSVAFEWLVASVWGAPCMYTCGIGIEESELDNYYSYLSLYRLHAQLNSETW